MTDLALTPAASRRASGRGADVDALWLATQHQVAGRVAHEIKNTLNGVAVNLEVVRSRLARAAASESGAGPAYAGPGKASTAFAETASTEFERVTAQAEALLALVRPVQAPTDVALVAAQLAALLGLAAARDGGRLIVEGTDDGGARTTGDGNVVRLVVAQAMLAALHDGAAHEVRCVVTSAPGEGPRLTITRTAGAAGLDALALPHDVTRVAAEAGIIARPDDAAGLILAFPLARGVDD